MTTKELKKKKGQPGWAVRRITFNLGTDHAAMLDELVAESKKDSHRSNMTSTVEQAIRDSYRQRISEAK